MKASTLFPSKYLRAADLDDREHRVIMGNIDMEDIASGEDKKPVLYFKGKQKGLVLNKTNTRVIAKAYGDDTEQWKNKSLILFSAIVDFRGEQVEAIRVKIPANKIETSPKRMKPTADEIENENPAEDMDDDIPF